jgi:hypothetical protein
MNSDIQIELLTSGITVPLHGFRLSIGSTSERPVHDEFQNKMNYRNACCHPVLAFFQKFLHSIILVEKNH